MAIKSNYYDKFLRLYSERNRFQRKINKIGQEFKKRLGVIRSKTLLRLSFM